MKTRIAVLTVLGLATAAVAIFIRTERGKKMKEGILDDLSTWLDRLASAADNDMLNGKEKSKQIAGVKTT